MRRVQLLPLLLVAAAPLQAQRHIERRIAVAPDAAIRIFNLTGQTRVIGWNRDSISVTADVPPRAGRFFLGGSGSAAKLGVFSDSLDAPGATLEIMVPRGAKVWIKSANADIDVRDVVGEIDASSVDGDITIDGAPARVSAEAMDGNIELTTRAAFTRAKTAGGSITLHGGGGDVQATSVSGTIRYVQAHKVLLGRLDSVTGSVSFDGTVMRGGTLSIETHDGAISLAVPPDQLAAFDVTTFGGTLTNRLSGAAPVWPRGKPVRFSTGSDGAQITVRTFRGDVLVSGM